MEIIHSINDVYAPVAKGHLKSSKIVMSASGVQGSRGRIMARLLTWSDERQAVTLVMSKKQIPSLQFRTVLYEYFTDLLQYL